MAIDNFEIIDDLLLGETTLAKITLNNLESAVKELQDKDKSEAELFRRLEQIRNCLDEGEAIGKVEKETLLNLTDVLLDIDFIDLQPSDLITYYMTIDSLVTHLDGGGENEKSTTNAEIIANLERVSAEAHKEFDVYVSEMQDTADEYYHDEYQNNIDDSWQEDDEQAPNDQSESDADNPKKEVVTTEDQEKKLVRFIEISTKVADLAEKHPFIKSLMYKASVGTMALITKLALKADLAYNKVETEYQTENQLRRSYFDVVKDGVDMYLRKPGTKLKYTRDEKYNGIDDWAHAMNGNLETYDGLSERLYGDLENPKKFGVVLFEAIRRKKTGEAVEAVKSKLIGLKDKVADYQTVADRDERFSNCDDLVSNIWKQFVDSDAESPKSASNLIAVCLEYSQGDFSQAMQLTGYVLKFVARSESNAVNSWQMREDLRDEYSEFHSFNRMGSSEESTHTPNNKFKARSSSIFLDKNPKADEIYFDTSYMNRLGLPYHAADMTSLLDTFSPECILLMMFGEYLMFGSEHGALKLLSDLRVASELYRIDNYAKKKSSL